MKTLLIILLSILICDFCHAAEMPAELANEMDRRGEGDTSNSLLAAWDRVPTENQPQLLGKIIRKLQNISEDPAFVRKDSAAFTASAALILSQYGTDDQIVEAFGNLSGFGDTQDSAAYALGACKGERGVKVLVALAEKRLSSLYLDWGSLSDDEKKSFEDETLIPFFRLIMSLYEARHPSGPIAAVRLRDKVFASPPSVFEVKMSDGPIFGEFFRNDLNERLTLIRQRRLKVEPSLELPLLEISLTQKERPNKSLKENPRTAPSKVDQEPVSFLRSYWLWIVGGIVLCLAVTLLRKRFGVSLHGS